MAGAAAGGGGSWGGGGSVWGDDDDSITIQREQMTCLSLQEIYARPRPADTALPPFSSPALLI